MAKLIALDIDGTLLNSRNEIDKEVISSIRKCRYQNKKIILCTGRSLSGLRDIVNQLNLDQNEYVISNNGALVTTINNSKTIRENKISFVNLKEVVETLDRLDLKYHVQSNRGIFTTNQEVDKYTKYDALLSNSYVNIISIEDFVNIEINKIMIVGEPEYLDEKIKLIPKELIEEFEYTKSLFCFRELLGKGATKGEALKFLCNYLGVSFQDVMAIGDNENDITMFEYAGTSVAMKNATIKVKKAADFVTDSNDNGGVSKALKLWG